MLELQLNGRGYCITSATMMHLCEHTTQMIEIKPKNEIGTDDSHLEIRMTSGWLYSLMGT